MTCKNQAPGASFLRSRCKPKDRSEHPITSRASLGYELILAIKHHTRRLYWFAEFKRVSFSITNFVMVAQQKYLYCAPYMIEIQRHMTYHQIRASLGLDVNEMEISREWVNLKSGSEIQGSGDLWIPIRKTGSGTNMPDPVIGSSDSNLWQNNRVVA
ncbi:hypothetical protein EVAR_36466_1 [Eumeta japonica]|uniref:Uncharacterized protein n=1 Tax=Eumeta variegata TaxID=151549 RepID=A0A4C1WSL4_EUMVA|nr:hypothetical protein EVAR_36466_1 [Eumeta japonica]